MLGVHRLVSCCDPRNPCRRCASFDDDTPVARQPPRGSAYMAADAPAALGYEANEVSGELVDGRSVS